jgi:hypothetical protein
MSRRESGWVLLHLASLSTMDVPFFFFCFDHCLSLREPSFILHFRSQLFACQLATGLHTYLRRAPLLLDDPQLLVLGLSSFVTRLRRLGSRLGNPFRALMLLSPSLKALSLVRAVDGGIALASNRWSEPHLGLKLVHFSRGTSHSKCLPTSSPLVLELRCKQFCQTSRTAAPTLFRPMSFILTWRSTYSLPAAFPVSSTYPIVKRTYTYLCHSKANASRAPTGAHVLPFCYRRPNACWRINQVHETPDQVVMLNSDAFFV